MGDWLRKTTDDAVKERNGSRKTREEEEIGTRKGSSEDGFSLGFPPSLTN